MKLSLNGVWRCTLPDGAGFDAQVPGCWDTYTEDKTITGPVLFEKTIFLPAPSSRQSVFLAFGGVSYACEVLINGHSAGAHEGMWDAFVLEITPYVRAGENTLSVSVVKPGYKDTDAYPLRQVLSGFIPDVLHTFGGLWDDVSLTVTEGVLIEHMSARGNAEGAFSVQARLLPAAEGETTGIACLRVTDADHQTVYENETEYRTDGPLALSMDGVLAEPRLWSPETPTLYRITLTVRAGGEESVFTRSLGFRDIRAQGRDLLINGRPVYVRGILHWGYYDDLVIPNPSREQIRAEIGKIKAMGFNMIKHCLIIPREEYLELCDEMGMLCWVELPLWLPDVTPELLPRMRREYPRILRALAGYASLAVISLGCELDSGVDGGLLEEMYHLARTLTGALVRDNSGSGECYEGLTVDYADFYDYHFYADLHYLEPLCETFTPSWRERRPWLFGEFCDSDSLRDLQPIRARLGVERVYWELKDSRKNPISDLKPDFYLDQIEARFAQANLREDWERLHRLSLNHSLVHRKCTIEATRCFAHITGYNITSLRDVPIAPHGLFDDFGAPKFDPAALRAFNSDTVLLPRWDLTRVWMGSDRVLHKERYNFAAGSLYTLHIVLSHYGADCLNSPTVVWRLLEGGTTPVLEGRVPVSGSFAPGTVSELCYLGIPLPQATRPVSYLLEVTMEADGQCVTNEWSIFTYPEPPKPAQPMALYDPAGVFAELAQGMDIVPLDGTAPVATPHVVVTSQLTGAIKAFVEAGGKAILVQRGDGVLPVRHGPFWRESMIETREHPLMDGLQPDVWQDDLRWFSLSTDTSLELRALDRAGMPGTALLRRIDCRTWEDSAYLAEFPLGKGTLLATTLRVEGGAGKQPLFVRRNLLARLLLTRAISYLQDGCEGV